ncbi:MAG: NusG-like protein [Bryobacteraceae bacterium]|jgi:transcription termination/antitermination protein NusG|nr:NusG-like protein [Bryobacteraceae bacterium]
MSTSAKLAPSAEPDWFALRVKPNTERSLFAALRAHGVETMLPLYPDRRQWSDRIRTIDRPLFPGYLFCRLHSATPLKLVTLPGAIGFVGFGSGPAPIQAIEIQALERILDSGRRLRPLSLLREGQRIRVVSGPLAGLDGHVLRIKDEHCLVVSISILQRSVAVTLDGDAVMPRL